jgi:hypothetical protein
VSPVRFGYFTEDGRHPTLMGHGTARHASRFLPLQSDDPEGRTGASDQVTLLQEPLVDADHQLVRSAYVPGHLARPWGDSSTPQTPISQFGQNQCRELVNLIPGSPWGRRGPSAVHRLTRPSG